VKNAASIVSQVLTFSILAYFCGAPLIAQDKKPTRTAKETILGEITLDQIDFKNRNFWISPDSRHYAFIDKAELIVDGKKQAFEGTANNGKGNIFSFSPDSQHFTYVGRDKEGKDWVYLDGKPLGIGHNFVAASPVFSPDSKHIAYTCRRYVGGGTKYYLVIDDKDRETYEEGTTWNITWSGDSQRVILGVEKDDKYLMREVSIDVAVPTAEHNHGPANLQLNPIRTVHGQLGYLARDADGQFLYFDGKEWGKGFKEIDRQNIVFSDDGKEVAIMGEISSFRDAVWHKGRMGKESRGMEEGTLTISVDGSRVGYVVEEFSKARAVIDGQESKEYREVAGITFSPDGKRVAYRAFNGEKMLLVINGVEGPGYDGMNFPAFSPDSKSIVCAASQGDRQFVLLDGQPSINGVPQKGYSKVTAPFFSPKGKHLLYLGETGGKKVLIDNGKPLESHDGAVDQFFFSEDESLLAYIAAVGEEEMVLINGAPGNKYETIMSMGGGGVIFDGNQKVRYIAITKDGKLLLVEEKLGE
jgi:Tol biopolymer transport system component